MDLTQSTPPSDKREALKWHNRRAIVEAAALLGLEHGISGFTVNDLAKEAGVSRRTIFNHFTGVEEAVQASFLDAMSGLYGQFQDSIGEQRFADLPTAYVRFAEVALELDVIGTVCEALVPFLPSPSQQTGTCSEADKPSSVPKQGSAELELLAVHSTDAAARKIVGLLHERVDTKDPFEAHLLAEYLITTITVSADRWFGRTHGELTQETRALWQELLQRGMNALGRGFAA
ncbi:TetR/AcrR family transcriptional regulator [Kocuria sp. ZOR0020]|uniref:TetR/AcrR family transcriptional regulator n=1 Tax=Kocuria sp. ZOR0020 TaxID=1339234 RepID=UPI00064663C4|nr:TetR/AcrR family transcriptional regulator [Kocuria sp. ZOR0020]